MTENQPAPIEYESRRDTRARWLEGLPPRLEPPAKAFGVVAWIGIIAILWGSALFPGGSSILFLGILVAPCGVVPIFLWEVLARPTLRWRHIDAPSVPRRWWIVAMFLLACAGLVTGTTASVSATLLRPVWLPVANYYYTKRPALAPAPRFLLLGPYLLQSPSVTPMGITGQVVGGGRVVVRWDDQNGYTIEVDPLW